MPASGAAILVAFSLQERPIWSQVGETQLQPSDCPGTDDALSLSFKVDTVVDSMLRPEQRQETFAMPFASLLIGTDLFELSSRKNIISGAH